MNLDILEHNQLLQALGWAVLHSLWQCLALYLLYKLAITIFRKIGANERYLLALIAFFASGIWFISTFIRILCSDNESFPLVYSNIVSQSFIESSQQLIGLAYITLLSIHVIYSVLLHKNQLVTLNSLPAQKAPAELRVFLTVMTKRFSISRKVVFKISEKISVPMVKGFLKPTIILPISAITGLTRVQLESIIIHELAHIKRNDYLINLFQIATNKILFFNPFIKLINKEITLYRENSCDDIVMLHGYDKTQYSKALLQLELARKTQEEEYALCLNATNGNKALLQRIKRLFDEKMLITNRVNNWRLAFNLSIIALCVVITSPLKQINPIELRTLYSKSLGNITLGNRQYLQNNIGTNSKKGTVNTERRRNYNAAATVAKKIDISNSAPTNIFVNSEWRNNTPTATAVSNPEDAPKTSIIQITEEGAGNNNNKTYYFEVDKSNGSMTIQPIMVIQNPASDSSKCLIDSTTISRSITL